MSFFHTRVWQVMISTFFYWLGINLVWLFLNFHLEALGLSRTFVGLANATPAIAIVVLGIPVGILIPRAGYVKNLIAGGWLAGLGLLLVAWAPNSGAVLVGLLAFGVGQVFVIGTAAPLMTALVDRRQQVLALSWQSAFGMVAGFIGNAAGGYLAEQLSGPRGVIYAAAGMFFLSTIPLLDLAVEKEWKARKFRLKNRQIWQKLLSLHLLIALGAGLIMPFLNLYLAEKFSLSFEEVGLLFALSSLATAAAMLLEPNLVKRLGKVGAIVFSQLLALPFIVVLAYVPNLPLVTAALFLRTALINGAYPVYVALAMELLSPEERSAFMLGVQSVWNIGWAVSSTISGQVQAVFGFQAFGFLFLGMLFCYSLSTFLYPRFFRLKHPEVNYEGNSHPSA